MIGAGVFVAFGSVANAAGNGVLVALTLFYCNTVASVQLAAQ